MIATIAFPALAQISERIEGIGAHFRKGGSATSVLLVLLFLAVAVALAYLLTRRQLAVSSPAGNGDPERLLVDVTRDLGLTADQRRFLTTAAKAMKLGHPCALLLSPTLFRQAAEQVVAGGPDRGDFVAQIREVLFPEC